MRVFVLGVIWGGFGEAAAKFMRWEAFGTAWDPPIPATDKPLILVTVFVLMLQAFSNLIRDWPAAAWVRKSFDVLAALVTGLCLWAMPLLFSSREDMLVPTVWRIVIGVLLLVSILCVLWGLWRDFNTTPEPVVESHDPADEVADNMRVD
ncbi:MAG: hypothetical protein R3E89_18935 [Thiolinea sp.]